LTSVATRKPIDRLRKIVATLPEATEQETWGHPTFRIGKKMFAGAGDHEGRPSMSCKAAPGVQRSLIKTDPGRFYVPAYVGPHGWVGAWLDGRPDWDHIADLVEDAYRRTAPKRLVRQLDGD
jgi:predicted DNA-binding protein (MmcQ/YjbR family)